MHTSDLDAVVAILIDVALAGGPEPAPADRDRMAAKIAAELEKLRLPR